MLFSRVRERLGAHSDADRRAGKAQVRPAQSDVARHALPATDKGDAGAYDEARGRADTLALLNMPRSAALDRFVRIIRAQDERDGRAEYSPLHPPDPSIVPAPVFTPSIQGWVPRAKQV